MKIEINQKGIREMLNSDGMLSELNRRGDRIAAAAGAGMIKLPAEKGRNRARVAVVTGTFEAMLREAKERALTRALDAGR